MGPIMMYAGRLDKRSVIRSGIRSGESYSSDTNTISVFRGKEGNQIVYLEFFNFKLNKIKKFEIVCFPVFTI
jgi:hypothetical protein